ncbi:MAG TPA: glycosyltransferase [Bacilli bacterium]|nr:glycosyltransferase [Bacilli bacterium]
MKKRILITYATYGSGHLAVAKYIEDYFKKQDSDFEILSIDLLKYSIPIVGDISKKVSDVVVVKFPLLCEIHSKLTHNKLAFYGSDEVNLALFNSKRLKKLITDFNPDITISTHFYGSSLIAKYNKEGIINSRLITIITDYKAHEFWLRNYKSEDAIIVPCREARRHLINKWPEIDKKKIKNFGLPIFNRMENELDYEKILKKHKIVNDRPIITFFGGSSYQTSNSYQFFRKLVRSNINAYVFYVTGNAKGLKEKAEKLVRRYNANNIKVLGYITDVPEYMTISDFIITKPGGIIANECIYFGKPMLLINRSGGQEKDNYKYLVRRGFALKANNIFTFTKYLRYLTENDYILDTMKNNILNYENKEAAKKLYNLAIKLLKDK